MAKCITKNKPKVSKTETFYDVLEKYFSPRTIVEIRVDLGMESSATSWV